MRSRQHRGVADATASLIALALVLGVTDPCVSAEVLQLRAQQSSAESGESCAIQLFIRLREQVVSSRSKTSSWNDWCI